MSQRAFLLSGKIKTDRWSRRPKLSRLHKQAEKQAAPPYLERLTFRDLCRLALLLKAHQQRQKRRQSPGTLARLDAACDGVVNGDPCPVCGTRFPDYRRGIECPGCTFTEPDVSQLHRDMLLAG
jgi:hypothetical protein